MLIISKSILSFALISLAACATASQPTITEGSSAGNDPIIQSRSTNFVTHDLEATTRFYTEYLGLKEAFRSDVNSPKSRETYGVMGEAKITVVGFFPPVVTDDQKGYAGIAFVAIEGENNAPMDQGPAYLATVGQIVLAHRVQNIDEIERRMKKAAIPIVSPLGPSATGKSRSMTVIDPNGIRIETYEYIKP